MCVVAYVSGHGFGHSAREIAILRHLPAHIPLIVKTAAPAWFWQREMMRPFELISDGFDVGCVQHTSLTVDISQTLAAAQKMHKQNAARAADEAAFLRDCRARIVLTDVASFPLTLARRVGIPGVCVANFTWADIYADYTKSEPDFAPLVSQMKADYARADLLLDAGLSLPMPYFPARETVGLVARTGERQRDKLLSALPSDAQKKRIALVYLGNWGFEIPFARLADLINWHFVSLDDAPVPLSNWTKINREAMAHPSLVASVDAVLSKAGYGLVGECLAHGTPLLYPARSDFAEFPALHAALQSWPGGIFVSNTDWQSANFGLYLDTVAPFGKTLVVPALGGLSAARKIAELWEAGG